MLLFSLFFNKRYNYFKHRKDDLKWKKEVVLIGLIF
ncbi:MAG TPA: hypothetical protein DIW21_04610 [Enterococcus sp.]|nr:hypothetical protein [Enterococcus sp.]